LFFSFLFFLKKSFFKKKMILVVLLALSAFCKVDWFVHKHYNDTSCGGYPDVYMLHKANEQEFVCVYNFEGVWSWAYKHINDTHYYLYWQCTLCKNLGVNCAYSFIKPYEECTNNILLTVLSDGEKIYDLEEYIIVESYEDESCTNNLTTVQISKVSITPELGQCEQRSCFKEFGMEHYAQTLCETSYPTERTAIPDEWACDPFFYGNDDGCDCNCGVIDPDCYNDDFIFNCYEGEATGCNQQGECEYRTYYEDVPESWTCDPMFYNALDGCDCGCGAYDPDCNIENSEVYWCPCGDMECNIDGVCVGTCNGYEYGISNTTMTDYAGTVLGLLLGLAWYQQNYYVSVGFLIVFLVCCLCFCVISVVLSTTLAVTCFLKGKKKETVSGKKNEIEMS
jgi:hypothetical protein